MIFRVVTFFFFFFFSSRRRHTRLVSDWSSDVCSSDLAQEAKRERTESAREVRMMGTRAPRTRPEIGRASCRERVQISVVAVSLKKKKKRKKKKDKKIRNDDGHRDTTEYEIAKRVKRRS